MDADELRRHVTGLASSAETLAALGAALRLRVSSQSAPPEVQACLDEVMAALGATEFLETGAPEQLAGLLSPIRAILLQSVDLLTDPTRAPGWDYADVELLESQGQSSALFASVIRREAEERLPDLAEALGRPGAAVLDVGVGIGGLSIAVCREFPAVRVVGIDPWDFALTIARRNVEGAGLGDRIELRRQAVQELTDEAAFDLIWLPVPFLPRPVLDLALGRSLAAAKPGGWSMLAMYRGRTELDTALARLRTARSGGSVLRPDEAEELLRAAGFEATRQLTLEGSLPGLLVCGRRPS